MTNDALAIMLLGFLDRPMHLALYQKGPRGEANPSLDDFELCSHTEVHDIRRKNWKVNEARVEATCERQIFKFSAKGSQVAGWVLLLAGENVVIDFGAYERPYPINSGNETVWAEPRLRMASIAGPT